MSEIVGVLLFIVLFGILAFKVSSDIGKLLAKRRREQFGPDYDDEWGHKWWDDYD